MKLQQMHADHHATVEDVPDEDDLPSRADGGDSSATWGPTMSAKAAGKQKENASPDVALDTRSEELFPSLGGGSAQKTAAPIKGPWAGGKPNGRTNGASPTNGASRASTPASDSPAPAKATHRGPPPPAMFIPGRNVESVTLEPQYILPRGQLKRPIPDVIKDLNRKSRANITMSSSTGGKYRFDATGPQDVAQQALKELVSQIGAKVRIAKI